MIKLLFDHFLIINKYLLGTFCENFFLLSYAQLYEENTILLV